MTSKIIPVEPFDYVLFGGTGDLAQRKLLPALYQRDHDGQLPEGARFIAASRGEYSQEAYQKFAHDALRKHVDHDRRSEESLQRFLARLDYVQNDVQSDDGWDVLKAKLDESGPDKIRAYYLAVGPSLFGPITQQLEKFGLIDDRSRLVIEKPFGRDLPSAEQ